MEDVICDLMDKLAVAADGEVEAVAAKLHKLRLRTAGADREAVIQAIQGCRELLSPAGRLRRAVALAVLQHGQGDLGKVPVATMAGMVSAGSENTRWGKDLRDAD